MLRMYTIEVGPEMEVNVTIPNGATSARLEVCVGDSRTSLTLSQTACRDLCEALTAIGYMGPIVPLTATEIVAPVTT